MAGEFAGLVDQWAGVVETAVRVWWACTAGSAVFVGGLAVLGVRRVLRGPLVPETTGEWEVAA